MEKQEVLAALAALAHETRLEVYRLCVRAAPDGATPGELAGVLGIPAATLSFHLKELRNAGLLESEREGRSLTYRPELAKMRDLIGYLTESCCAGLGTSRGRR